MALVCLQLLKILGYDLELENLVKKDIVKDKVIYTPKLSNELLPGVTRDLLIDLLNNQDMEVIESDITVDELLLSDEIWCSSSTNAVVPIVKVDDTVIGTGSTGDISTLAHKITKDFIDKY